MPSKNSKIISVRVPERVNFECSMGKLVTSLYDLIESGVIKVENDCIVVGSDCDGCPYVDDLDMGKFNEVCEFKNLDRQKALDRCVSMLWR